MAKLFEVTISGLYAEQRWINRFNYVGSDAVGTRLPAAALADALGFDDVSTGVPGVQLEEGTLGWAMAGLISSAATIDTLQVLNVYDPLDFYSTLISPALQGNINGDPEPPFLAYKLRSTVIRRDIRSGQKAIVGVVQDAHANGGIIVGDAVTRLNNLAIAMSEILEVMDGGVTLTFTPAIVSKFKYEVPNTNPVRFAYKYKENDAVGQLAKTAVGVTWQPQPRVTSQVSRKRGRGI